MSARRREARWSWVAVALVVTTACVGRAAPGPTGPERVTRLAAEVEPAPASATARYEVVELASSGLSEFAGDTVTMKATVLTPPGFDPARRYPIVYVVHGFGGGHARAARKIGPEIERAWASRRIEPMVYAFLDATHPMGHHVFADSANTGPWSTAMVLELVPAIEGRFAAVHRPYGRFVTGHSSGGWSSLWLQVRWPEFFGGVCSTAPDPVDFRHFTGIDIYAWDNMYRDPAGESVPLMRKGEQWGMTFEEFVRLELRTQPVGGQIYSFDAVFSPRGKDGQPRFLFDRNTGVIAREVAEEWKKYDISLILRTQWARLGPLLRGKIHVIVGTRDTFRLEGAVKLLDAELKRLGSDAEILFVPGRDHGDLYAPHRDLYPHGLHVWCARQMWDSYEAAVGRASVAKAVTKTRTTRSGQDSARSDVERRTLAHAQHQGVIAAQ